MTDPFVGRLTFVRVYSGILKSGTAVFNANNGETERIGRIVEMHANNRKEITEITTGNIAAVIGLKETKTGHTLCDKAHPIKLLSLDFPEPVISVSVEPKTKADQEKMGVALRILLSVFVLIVKRDRPLSLVWESSILISSLIVCVVSSK